MLTAVFVHGDMEHLLHNVPVYLFFAWILQGYFGSLASVVLPLMIGFLSNGVTVFFYDDQVHLLGASGMIYGMVALWLMLYIHFDRKSWWVKRVGRAVGFSLLVMFPETYEPKVSYLAHFTGFTCGLILGWVSMPLIRRWAPIDFDDAVENTGVDK
jgi:rhomboid protease GluP